MSSASPNATNGLIKIEETKTMKRLFCILIMIFSVFAIETFSKEWNGIMPGVSTRLEVKKILGKGDPWQGELAYYRLKKFTVYISYDKKEDNYSDKDIVAKIDVSPDNRGQPLASYIKKIPNFHKDFIKREIDDRISHVNGLTYYRNNAEGFEIKVQHGQENGREVITGFSYFAGNY